MIEQITNKTTFFTLANSIQHIFHFGLAMSIATSDLLNKSRTIVQQIAYDSDKRFVEQIANKVKQIAYDSDKQLFNKSHTITYKGEKWIAKYVPLPCTPFATIEQLFDKCSQPSYNTAEIGMNRITPIPIYGFQSLGSP